MSIAKPSLLTQISVAHLISHVHIMVLPVLMPIIISQGKISFVEIGVALSVFNLVSAIAQTPMGLVVDRFGAKTVLIFGLLLGSLSFLSLGFIHGYWWLIITMGLAGIANAVYHPADYAILSTGIDENRMGRAFSIHTFAGFLGTAITPGLFLGIESLSNINIAYSFSGILGLLAIIILLPNAKNSKTLVVDLTDELTKKIAKPVSMLQLFSPSIILLMVLFMFLNLSTGSIQNFSVSTLISGYQISLFDANAALTTFLFCSAFGVLSGGILADKTKQHGLFAAVALAITGILMTIITFTSLSAIILIIMMGVIGFLSGVITPSRDMLVRAASPAGAEGRVFGIVSTGFSLGSAIGPIIFGWLLDHNYPRAVFALIVVFIIFTVILALYQEIKERQ